MVGLALIVIMFATLWLTNFYLGLGVGGKNKEAGILAMWFYVITIASCFCDYPFDSFFITTTITTTATIGFVILFIAFFTVLPFGFGCFFGRDYRETQTKFLPCLNLF